MSGPIKICKILSKHQTKTYFSYKKKTVGLSFDMTFIVSDINDEMKKIKKINISMFKNI